MTQIMEGNALGAAESARTGRLAPRHMVWIKTPRMEAWTCFACAWAFRPSGPPVGNNLDEMMLNYELQRDKEYGSHVCSNCPRAKIAHEILPDSPRVGDPIFNTNSGIRWAKG